MKRHSIHRSLLLVGVLVCAGCQATHRQPFRLDSMLASMRAEQAGQSVVQADVEKQGAPSAGLPALREKIPFVRTAKKPGNPTHPLIANQKASAMQTVKQHASSVMQKTLANSRSTTAGLDPTNLAYQPGPIQPELHLSAARVMEQQGNLPGAEKHYEELLKLEPNNRHGLIGQARMNHRLGQMDQAIAGYQLALSRLGQDAVVLNDLGLCFARCGREQEALTVLRTAVALKPDSVMYRNNLAAVLVQSDQPDQAVGTLATTHGEVLAHYNVAYLLNENGNSGLAHFHFSEALRRNPDFEPARTMLDQLVPMVGQRPETPKNDFSATAIPAPIEDARVDTISYEALVPNADGPDLDSVISVSATALSAAKSCQVAADDPAALFAEASVEEASVEEASVEEASAPAPIDVTATGDDVGRDELGLRPQSSPEIRLPRPIGVSKGDPRMIAPTPDDP